MHAVGVAPLPKVMGCMHGLHVPGTCTHVDGLHVPGTCTQGACTQFEQGPAQMDVFNRG